MSTATNIVRCFTLSDQSAVRIVASVSAVRSINPLGAGLIFTVAYLAGLMGSLAAALVALALLVGLYAARVSGESLPAYSPMPIEPQAAHGCEVFGLPVKSMTFARPSKAAKAKSEKSASASAR